MSHPSLEQRGVHADVKLAFPRSLRSETSVFGETPVLKASLFSRKSFFYFIVSSGNG